MNNRRKLVIALGAGALAAPLASFAQQQGKTWRVGMLSAPPRPTPSKPDLALEAFILGLRDLGYVEGKNLVLEWRAFEGEDGRMPGLAAELVQAKCDVIVTLGTSTTLAAQKATAAIPIVMIGVADPVGDGVVKSLARPGGNTTGIANLIGSTTSKALELLLAAVPKLSSATVLTNPTNRSHPGVLRDLQAVAQKRGVKVLPVQARNAQEIEAGFAEMARLKSKATIVLLEAVFQLQKSQIIELAAKHRLPTIAMYGEFVEAGGLLSYGANRPDYYGRAATFVDRILKGAKPADLPVEQPMKFELFINMKTAKALGIKISPELLLRADRVIE